MSADPLRGPKAKIERAKKHIAEVVTQISAFLDPTPPFEIFKEVEPDGAREMLKVRMIRTIPDELAATVGDVLINLRSALDQLACALAVKNGAAGISGVYFPFAGDKTEFERPVTQRKMGKLSADAQSLICELKPYKGGNDFLWALNRLAARDKHQSLIAVGALTPGWSGRLMMKALDTNPHVFEMPTRVRLDKDAMLLRYRAGGDIQGDIEFTLDVAFDEDGAIKDQPVLAVLQQYVNLVGRIILLFEERFFK